MSFDVVVPLLKAATETGDWTGALRFAKQMLGNSLEKAQRYHLDNLVRCLTAAGRWEESMLAMVLMFPRVGWSRRSVLHTTILLAHRRQWHTALSLVGKLNRGQCNHQDHLSHRAVEVLRRVVPRAEERRRIKPWFGQLGGQSLEPMYVPERFSTGINSELTAMLRSRSYPTSLGDAILKFCKAERVERSSFHIICSLIAREDSEFLRQCSPLIPWLLAGFNAAQYSPNELTVKSFAEAALRSADWKVAVTLLRDPAFDELVMGAGAVPLFRALDAHPSLAWLEATRFYKRLQDRSEASFLQHQKRSFHLAMSMAFRPGQHSWLSAVEVLTHSSGYDRALAALSALRVMRRSRAPWEASIALCKATQLQTHFRYWEAKEIILDQLPRHLQSQVDHLCV